MIHLGDITKIKGSEIPVVDCITGGSPCQDLSVAGKRAGLAGERSGLFMEQVRIVREMRERDRARGWTGYMVRPRYMVWENVPGAFSSAKGEDFAAVVEEILKVCEPGASVSVRVPDRGWPKSGCYYADDGSWSIAWRVHDAQFWGVPQRRKRIALVADFGGLSAPEVLFERKGLRWHPDESEPAGKEAAGATVRCACGAEPAVYNGENITSPLNKTDVKPGDPCHTLGMDTRNYVVGALSTLNNQSVFCLQGNGIDRADTAGCNGKGWREDVSYTLNTIDRPAVCAGFDGNMGAKAGNIGYAEEQAPTLNAGKEMHCYDARGNGDGQTVCTLTGDHQNRVTDYTAVVTFAERSHGDYKQSDVGSNQNARQGKSATDLICYGLDCRNGRESAELLGTLQAKESGGYSYNCTHPIRQAMTVRRLTPLECERLQGYPDGWTDIGEWTDSKGKKRQTTDTARYKALGNSIALPFWFWLLRRISAQYERPATLGSLFDGIGGFPLCWERCNGKGTAIWASEIEEFPIAVTKRRFGDG